MTIGSYISSGAISDSTVFGVSYRYGVIVIGNAKILSKVSCCYAARGTSVCWGGC